MVWDKLTDESYGAGASKIAELKALSLAELLSMRTGYEESGFKSQKEQTDDPAIVHTLNNIHQWWHDTADLGNGQCFKCSRYLAGSSIVNYVIKSITKTAENPDGWGPAEYASQTSASLPGGKLGLFEALGMAPGSYDWAKDQDGVALAAIGMHVTIEDMAKFGQLMLQKGSVELGGVSHEIVPEYWVDAMTTVQAEMLDDAKSDNEYGYQWWPQSGMQGSYCAEGAGGQSLCVYPAQRTVIAITGAHGFAPLELKQLLESNELNFDATFGSAGSGGQEVADSGFMNCTAIEAVNTAPAPSPTPPAPPSEPTTSAPKLADVEKSPAASVGSIMRLAAVGLLGALLTAL